MAHAAPTSAREIADAASVILVRKIADKTHVLMGQRGGKAAFMPSKFVFPGGRVDSADYHSPDLSPDLSPKCRHALEVDADPAVMPALLFAAIRELWEETGLCLGALAKRESPPPPLEFIPSAKGVAFFFRAITPPGKPRRFDARFFLVDAGHIANGLDDFSKSSGELSHLGWFAIDAALEMDIPAVTRKILGALAAHISGDKAPGVAYYPDGVSGGLKRYITPELSK